MKKDIFPVTVKQAKKNCVNYSSANNREALFPSRLRELRAEQGLSQEKASKFLKISKSTLGLYETGDTLPDASTLRDLSTLFGVSTDYLLFLDEYREKGVSKISAQDLGLSEKAAKVLLNNRHLSELVSELIELEDGEADKPVLSLIGAYLYIKGQGSSYGDTNVFSISDNSDDSALARVLEKVTYNHVAISAFLNEAVDNIRALGER